MLHGCLVHQEAEERLDTVRPSAHNQRTNARLGLVCFKRPPASIVPIWGSEVGAVGQTWKQPGRKHHHNPIRASSASATDEAGMTIRFGRVSCNSATIERSASVATVAMPAGVTTTSHG